MSWKFIKKYPQFYNKMGYVPGHHPIRYGNNLVAPMSKLELYNKLREHIQQENNINKFINNLRSLTNKSYFISQHYVDDRFL